MQHSETRIVPYSADLMYRIVADIEMYPDFLPWCLGLHILSREAVAGSPGSEVLLARMDVGFHGARESYISRVVLCPEEYRIDVTQAEGPLRTLDTHWHFTPAGEGAQVEFSVAFEFKRSWLNAAASGFFGPAVREMEHAFTERAKSMCSQP
jgi:coenzyme Q-binding protein COQ10